MFEKSWRKVFWIGNFLFKYFFEKKKSKKDIEDSKG